MLPNKELFAEKQKRKANSQFLTFLAMRQRDTDRLLNFFHFFFAHLYTHATHRCTYTYMRAANAVGEYTHMCLYVRVIESAFHL